MASPETYDPTGWHGTTILAVRKGSRVVIAGDGQVTLGNQVIKSNARKVRRLAEFGAFVELVPGVEGLLHVSQLGGGRARHARDVLKAGEELTVRVTKVDAAARRITLSRLDARGALLDSEEAAEGGLIEEVIEQSKDAAIGTNLGDLFRKALKKDR